MQPFPTEFAKLKTQRLIMRSMTASDRDSLFTIYGDPEVMRFASDETFSSPATVDVMLSNVSYLFNEELSIEWGIERCADHKLIGTCGLHSFNAMNNSAEVGCLLARSVWGCGYMLEALHEVIRYAFYELEVTLLQADIDAPNHRSIRLFNNLGFVYKSGTVYSRSFEIQGSDVPNSAAD